MKKKVGILLFGVLIFSSCGLLDNEQASAKYRLWADQPAKRFEESFPLGNGRLGMMPDGGIAKETIVLNDITLWSGCVTRQPVRCRRFANYSNRVRMKRRSVWYTKRLLVAGEEVRIRDMARFRFSVISNLPINMMQIVRK